MALKGSESWQQSQLIVMTGSLNGGSYSILSDYKASGRRINRNEFAKELKISIPSFNNLKLFILYNTKFHKTFIAAYQRLSMGQ